MKACCYYRVSSKRQMEAESIDMQKEQMRPWFEKQGWHDVAEFIDDGVTGEQLDRRPQFMKLLEGIRNGEFDTLCCYMADRLGRFWRRKDRNRVLDVFIENKIVVYVFRSGYRGGIEPFDCSDEDAVDILEGLLTDARKWNRGHALRVVDGQKAALHKNRPGTRGPPYGIDWVWEDRFRKIGRFEINEVQYGCLQEMYRLFMAGNSLKDVTNVLNSDLAKYPTTRGGNWRECTIHALWRNDTLFTGTMIRNKSGYPRDEKTGNRKLIQKPKDEWITVDAGIRLFSKDEVMAVRLEMSNRRKTGKQKTYRQSIDFLLRKLIRCGRCGCNMMCQPVQKKSGALYTYYTCPRGVRGECKTKGIKSAQLDLSVWQRFVYSLSDPERLRRAIAKEEFISESKRSDLEALLKTCDRKITEAKGKLDRLGELYVEGDIPKKRYQEEKKKGQDILERLKQERSSISQRLEHPDRVAQACEIAAKSMREMLEAMWKLQGEYQGTSWDQNIEASARTVLLDEYGRYTVAMRDAIHRQKRAILRQYVASGLTIRVWSADKFEIEGILPVKGSGWNYSTSRKVEFQRL